MIDENGLGKSDLDSVPHEALSREHDFAVASDAVSLHCEHEQESLLAHFVHYEEDETELRVDHRLMGGIGLDANGTDY